jgi:hypothetical protein
MQYVLGLAILCKKYKKNPIVRLFIDNQFIDEFIVNNTTKLFNGPLWPGIPPEDEQLQLSFANKYKMFELDEKILKDGSKIVLEVQNTDSNWMNGFITKSTLIAIHNIFLIPKSLLKRYQLIFKAFYKHRRIYKEGKRMKNGWAGWPLAASGFGDYHGGDTTIEYTIQKKCGIYIFDVPEENEHEFLCLSRLINGLCSFDNFDKYLHEN